MPPASSQNYTNNTILLYFVYSSLHALSMSKIYYVYARNGLDFEGPKIFTVRKTAETFCKACSKRSQRLLWIANSTNPLAIPLAQYRHGKRL